jgi:hypothetical protein
MRRVGVILTVCLLAILALPVPAHALFWRWLDELSGPGGFNGYEIDVRLYCFNEPADPTLPAVEETKDPARRAKAFAAGVIVPGCVFNHVPLRNVRRASINLGASYLYANHSHLQYANDESHAVQVMTLRPTAWIRPARSVEVGAGVALYRFTGPGFEPIERFVIEPLLIDVKPFALLRDAISHRHDAEVREFPDSQWDLFLSVRLGIVYSPKGFDATDFGAIPGTFHTNREVLPTASILLDLDWLARRLRRP